MQKRYIVDEQLQEHPELELLIIMGFHFVSIFDEIFPASEKIRKFYRFMYSEVENSINHTYMKI